MRNLVGLLLVLVPAFAACGGPAPQPAPQPPPLATQPEAAPPIAAPPALPARIDYAVGQSPMSLVIAREALVWTDGAGAIWTMPIAGGTPTQLSDQHSIGFTFHPVVVGDEVFVSTKRDFVRVGLPRGPVTKLGLALSEDPVEVVADDERIYVTLFKRDDVMAVPVRGGAPTKLFAQKRGVLAHHGGTLYSISYATGALVAVPTSGGKPKQIARGFRRPTALAADDTAAFVYSEQDKTIQRVELATGATRVIAKGLENSDDLVSDGEWLYTFSWPSQLVRIAKDGSRQDVLADDLAAPYHVVVEADAIYVVSRDQDKIVRLRK